MLIISEKITVSEIQVFGIPVLVVDVEPIIVEVDIFICFDIETVFDSIFEPVNLPVPKAIDRTKNEVKCGFITNISTGTEKSDFFWGGMDSSTFYKKCVRLYNTLHPDDEIEIRPTAYDICGNFIETYKSIWTKSGEKTKYNFHDICTAVKNSR